MEALIQFFILQVIFKAIYIRVIHFLEGSGIKLVSWLVDIQLFLDLLVVEEP